MPSFTVEKVAAQETNPQTSNPKQNNEATLNCPQNILRAFQETLKGSKILGASFLNPYTGKQEVIPENPADLTARHLQILARIEHQNTDGSMKVELYNNLLTEDQIARIRCLVKSTNGSLNTAIEQYGGYPAYNPVTKLTSPTPAIVIDQAGLQWQDDFRNTGGLFFYPTNSQDPRLPQKYSKFQNDMFQAMYEKDRPSVPSQNNIDVTWNGVKGKLDLDQVANAIGVEFLQALEATSAQANKTLGPNDKVNFKFLKAGMGFFAAGLECDKSKLELARLQGIHKALKSIDSLPEDEKRTLLGKIRRIDLPFSDGTNPEIHSEIQAIKSLSKSLGLDDIVATEDDVFKPTPGYVNASTNCGDPHAMPGNEGGYQSVDAMMHSNNANLSALNVALNPSMKLNYTKSSYTQLLQPVVGTAPKDKKAFMLDGDGNKAIGIQKLSDGRFKITGINTAGQERQIYIQPDGKILGFDNKPPQGHVAKTMAAKVSEIFNHFDVSPPTNLHATVIPSTPMTKAAKSVSASHPQGMSANPSSTVKMQPRKKPAFAHAHVYGINNNNASSPANLQAPKSDGSEKMVHLSKAKAKEIYLAVEAMGKGKLLEGLSNKYTPNKISKALEILNVSYSQLKFNGYNGYHIQLNEQNWQKLSSEKLSSIGQDASLKGYKDQLGKLRNQFTTPSQESETTYSQDDSPHKTS